MHFLYGLKANGTKRLVATFDSEQQLLAYVLGQRCKSSVAAAPSSSRETGTGRF